MNKEEALVLFLKLDDPVHWEYPENFDYSKAVSRFREFSSALDALKGISHKTETETYIQDASFHSQIDLGSGWLRFSNFGNMVSITPDHEVDDATLAIVQQLCNDKGYVFIPTEFAENQYSGDNPGVTGIQDWWVRYFDWV